MPNCELEAAGQAITADSGDHWLGDALNRLGQLTLVLHISERVGQRLDLDSVVEVGAGREELLRARDDDPAHLRLRVEERQGRDDLADQLLAERVVLLGPVERDHRRRRR
jgi:hypothetical protein